MATTPKKSAKKKSTVKKSAPRKSAPKRSSNKKSAARKSQSTQAAKPTAASAAPRAETRSDKRIASAAKAGGARTIIYVHGIGNKPTADILKCQWDEALFGFNLGERSRLAYWVNRIFYPEPTAASCKMADSTQDAGSLQGDTVGARALAVADDGIVALLPPDAREPAQRAVLEKLAKRALEEPDLGAVTAADFHARVLPLPKPIRDFVSRRITKAWLKDVNEFLFDETRRTAMRQSVLDRLSTGGGPFVVIAHSQGSMVAYDALCSLPADTDVQVDLFVTIGSPLGLKEVQDQLELITKQPKKLATPAVVKRWINVADPLDPVCADKRLRSDYSATNGVRVEDFLKFNTDSPRDPHSGSGYLSLPAVREPVRDTIDRTLFQRIAPFTISRDLVGQMEKFTPEERHTVLIELRDEFPTGKEKTIDEVRSEVVQWIDRALESTDPRLTREDIELEQLAAYVSAKLTRSEVERLSAELQVGSVYRVFRNSRKRALLDHSINVLQCATAHRGYDSRGQGITWAVLDTGIDHQHPHFAGPANIASVYDCMKSGDIKRWDDDPDSNVGYDGNGHGTHVAGIIAGGMGDPVNVCGIAPSVKIVSYKVLNDEGSGSDAKIIKALDHIYETNRTSSSLAVHGVNLSLGGPFDPESFGCGDTPICKQLRRLWRQGVVVVLAAGNEGYLEIQQGDEAYGINSDLSIGDPANLEEAIAVGSIHKSKPHLYGVSYFSSRGPTADGRAKPDVVAPGERILSCRAGANPATKLRNNLYVTMSGTSMAAPHVSGVIACFLSVRKEFIGYPERVKKILLDSCTDLKRDPLHQGAGMPNLVKMLLGT